MSAFAAAIALAAPQSGGAYSAEWCEMTVGHLHLMSTLDKKATRDIARKLQAFEDTAGRLLESDEQLPDVPTDIYVLDRRDYFYYAAGRPGVIGQFLDRPYRNLIIIDASMPFDRVSTTLFHEYTHFLQRSSTTQLLPPWFMEGYAELFSSFRLDKQTMTIGELPIGVGVDVHRWIPVERVLNVTKSDPEYRTERLAPEFYGESWALVHYLMFDQTALAHPTAVYLENLNVGVAEPDAFSQAFPFDKQALDKALQDLIKNRTIHVRKLTWKNDIAVDNAVIAPMTAARVDEALLRASFEFGYTAKALDTRRTEMMSRHPHDPEIVALNARVAAHTGQQADLGDLVAQLLAVNSADHAQLRIDVADTLLARAAADKEGVTGSEARDAAAILDELVHTKEPPVEAVALWAAAELEVSPVVTAAALKPLIARAPHNTQVLRELALVSEKLGDRRAARGYYERIILVSEHPEERLWAQKQADSTRLQ